MSYLDRNEQLQFDITELGAYDIDHDDLVPEQPCRTQASNRFTNQGAAKRYLCYLKAKEAVSRPLKITDLEQKNDPLLSIPEEYRVYEKLFAAELETGLPEHTNFDHKIPIKEGKEPKFNKIYGLNPTEMEALDKYLDKNLKKGYIRESTSPAGSPILFRLLYGANYFTALDLKGAYNLIRMKQGEEWKTAFRTRKGHFEYLVMPFGLTNAPATFQNIINQVFRKFVDIFVVVYLDDILIFSATMK
ncbi:hypothetical protein CcaCcLH18_14362 [Colletotrichum camelliae]|nr:hypothetical protein CcaCcLH18_14362 [Colletotrichum camelliae]